MRLNRPSVQISPAVSDAINSVRSDVGQRGNPHDIEYFTLHERRFARTAQRIADLMPPGAELLDIGSHYLHLTAVLGELGFRVTGLDVTEFVQLPFVRERAARYSIDNLELAPNALPNGDLLEGSRDRFDGVIFCEILEHITFNPIALWRRIYELLRVGGVVYVTTPNGLQLLGVLGAVWHAVSLRGRGIRVEHIFSNVTYGHHWKEYGPRELQEYFARLSPDFDVTVSGFAMSGDNAATRRREGQLRRLLRRAGNATSLLAEDLEAVVRLRERRTWLAQPPSFG